MCFWFSLPWRLVMLSISSCVCWPSVYLLWKNVYSGLLSTFYLFLFFKFILFILRKREHMRGAKREEERQNPKKALHCGHRARCRAQTHKPWDYDLSQDQEFDAQLTEPPRCLCPFFNWIVCFLSIELYNFFIYFGYQPLVRYITYKYLLPFSNLSFCIVDGFLHCLFFF